MTAPVTEIVVDAPRLAAVAATLATAPAIAVDTEFVRRTTFHAIPGLLQLSAGAGEFLVDLVALRSPRELQPLFAAAAPLKVMHSCSEDLEVLKNLFGAAPGSLVDTQVAAAMLGHPLQTSYQNLVRAVLGIDIPKDETRSDWVARPLSPAQLEYAALDVRLLLTVWQRLAEQLDQRGRRAWLDEDCARLLADAGREQDPQDYYRGIGSAFRLRTVPLRRLRALAAWREQAARTHDKPRAHIVPDGVLVLLATRRPEHAAQLRNIEDLHPAALRRHGDDILAVLAAADNDDSPVAPVPPPLPRAAKAVLAELRALAETQAKALGVEVEVLVRRRHLEALVAGARDGEPQLPPMLSGWRRAVIGEQLLEAVRARQAQIRSWDAEAEVDA